MTAAKRSQCHLFDKKSKRRKKTNKQNHAFHPLHARLLFETDHRSQSANGPPNFGKHVCLNTMSAHYKRDHLWHIHWPSSALSCFTHIFIHTKITKNYLEKKKTRQQQRLSKMNRKTNVSSFSIWSSAWFSSFNYTRIRFFAYNKNYYQPYHMNQKPFR